MGEIFKSSEPHEKRAFLNYLLQNPTVSGKKLDFTVRKPYNAILEVATCPTGLRGLYQVRTAIKSTYAHHFAIVREWGSLVEME
jgi:hypothetical protein